MAEFEDSEATVGGFEFSAVSCGLKKVEAPDLALIYSQEPATVAGVFTTNRVAAAPVILDRERLPFGRVRAVLANAGCANACTGQEGYQDAVTSARWVARALGIRQEEVLVASTGVIGVPLPMERIRDGVPRLVKGLKKEGLPQVARAIMTTDTRPKWTCRSLELSGVPVRMAAVVKGAGMIHPKMATLLCFVVTDASVPAPLLQRGLERGLKDSFHAITVDGDTSTNDTVLVLANGASGAAPLARGSGDARVFQRVLGEVLSEMALAVVRDGEGATKLVHIRVEGTRDHGMAMRVARAVAHSPLVKTAFYGEEVNWGRIMAAAGYSGVPMDPQEMDLWYDGIQIVRSGRGMGPQAERDAQAVAQRKEFTVRVSVGKGEGSALVHTCDLSHDYVSINASYKT